MIKHIVMWRLHEQANGASKLENANKMKVILEGLNNRIEGLIQLEVGVDFAHSEASADVVLYSELSSKEALAHYQQHPEHLAAAAFIKAVVIDRVVVDYEA